MAEKIDLDVVKNLVKEASDFPYAAGYIIGEIIKAHNTLVDEFNHLQERFQDTLDVNSLWDGS